jgi:hypothetical protein
MSSSSTRKSTSRTRKRSRTPYTISIIWPDGSGFFDLPISLPVGVEGTLRVAPLQAHVEIWKSSERPSAIGAESGVALLRTLYSPPSPAPATAGAQDQQPRDYSKHQDGYPISRGSSSWASIPAPDPETSLDCNGRK